ncbi:MAG: hypothetical protein VXY27_03760, partial [Thermoproteota archaeon]|nr:hypothetical protein [Thermoproteota archaeon]
FYIGRDHAGAENLYPAENAVKIVKKFSRKFKIKSVTSAGGFFCKKCKKFIAPGITSKIRLGSKPKSIRITCSYCNHTYRKIISQ